MTEHLSEEQLNLIVDRISHRTVSGDDADPQREHIEQCAACRERFGKLARMVTIAESMPRRVEPPVNLWPAIRASIDSTKSASTPARAPDQRKERRWYARPHLRTSLAAAAVVLIAVFIGIYSVNPLPRPTAKNVATGQVPDSSSTLVPPTSGEISAVDAATPSTDPRVEAELLAALELRRSALRPSTRATIDSSLRVIDAAIAELEAARARDPNNAVIRQLLASSRARKVELLKQAQNAS